MQVKNSREKISTRKGINPLEKNRESENGISTTLKISIFKDTGKVMLLLMVDDQLPNRDSG